MRISARAFVVAVALAATVAAGAPAADGAKRAATPRLKAFASCAGLIGYARRHVPPPRPVVPPRLPPPARPTPAAAATGDPPDAGHRARPVGRGGGDSSTTNIQEAGVDEPDIVKSDGTNVYTLTGRDAARHRRAQPRRRAAQLGEDRRLRRRVPGCRAGASS